MGTLMNEVVVGVDGGNSKTDLAIADTAGRVLAVVRGPGSSPDKLGVHGALDVIVDLLVQASTRAGLPPGTRPAALAALLAGLDLPEDAPTFAEALAGRYPGPAMVVDNDTVAVLLAGTGGEPGAAVVCGAGINAAGISRFGARSSFLSLGQLSGDWGGGISLGREVLWHAIRAEDGRGAPTALRAAVCSHFGFPSVTDLVLAIHRGHVPEVRLAELVPALLQADADGDSASRAIVDRLAREVAEMARTMLTRADLLAEAVPVVLAGGVLMSGHDRLLREVQEQLARAAPMGRPHLLRCRPVAGALIAALHATATVPASCLQDVTARVAASTELKVGF